MSNWAKKRAGEIVNSIGWRLHRGKQLCPECAHRVAKRLAAKRPTTP